MEKHDFLGVLGHVRSGVKQIFERIDNEGKIEAVEEVEKRFEWFTKKVSSTCSGHLHPANSKQTLPALQRSAVMRENTLIVIPSYFDFVRVTNFLRKAEDVSYVAVSE
jgi:U3 small nucleolar RNA-associated protein 25